MSFTGRSIYDVERPRVLNLRVTYTYLPFTVQLCPLRPKNPPSDLLKKQGRTTATSNLSEGTALLTVSKIAQTLLSVAMYMYLYFTRYDRVQYASSLNQSAWHPIGH